MKNRFRFSVMIKAAAVFTAVLSVCLLFSQCALLDNAELLPEVTLPDEFSFMITEPVYIPPAETESTDPVETAPPEPTEAPKKPKFSLQPTQATGTIGQSVQFHVEVERGTEPYTYQWYMYISATGRKSTLGESETFVNVKTNTLTVNIDRSYDGVFFFCVATDANGKSVDSNMVEIAAE